MSETNDSSQTQEFRLRHRITGRMPSLHAHNLIIQPMAESIVISFFETILPPTLNPTPEQIEQLREVGVLSECIARITMSPQAFLNAADAMQQVATSIREQDQGVKDAKL